MGDRAYVDVLFFSTPTLLGRAIRCVTSHPYNHVSLRIGGDRDPNFWSFARRYAGAPLYGGLVRESPLRYQGALVKVCRVPVRGSRLAALRCGLAGAWSVRDRYLYDTASALLSLAGRRVRIPMAFTCVSFAQTVLAELGLIPELTGDGMSVRTLEQALEPFVVYAGVFRVPAGSEWGLDEYPAGLSPVSALRVTARHFVRLAGRAVSGIPDDWAEGNECGVCAAACPSLFINSRRGGEAAACERGHAIFLPVRIFHPW